MLLAVFSLIAEIKPWTYWQVMLPVYASNAKNPGEAQMYPFQGTRPLPAAPSSWFGSPEMCMDYLFLLTSATIISDSKLSPSLQLPLPPPAMLLHCDSGHLGAACSWVCGLLEPTYYRSHASASGGFSCPTGCLSHGMGPLSFGVWGISLWQVPWSTLGHPGLKFLSPEHLFSLPTCSQLASRTCSVSLACHLCSRLLLGLTLSFLPFPWRCLLCFYLCSFC